MTAYPQNTDIKGVVPPIVTPLLDNDRLDHPGLEKLVSHLIAGGIHGIFVLGTTGEFPGLSRSLRHEMMKEVCRLVDQRIPVLAGITDTSMEESLRLAETAYTHGARGVVMAPPYYFPLKQDAILEYYSKMAGSLPLPLYLYNIPSTTHVNIRVETVEKAAKIKGIHGIKDSTGDPAYFSRLIQALKKHPGFTVFMGSEELMVEALRSGATGCVVGGANAFPSLYVRLYDAVIQKNDDQISLLSEKVDYIGRTFYQIGGGGSGTIRIIKGILSCLGIIDDVLTQPFQPLSDHERNQIKQYIQEMEQL